MWMLGVVTAVIASTALHATSATAAMSAAATFVEQHSRDVAVTMAGIAVLGVIAVAIDAGTVVGMFLRRNLRLSTLHGDKSTAKHPKSAVDAETTSTTTDNASSYMYGPPSTYAHMTTVEGGQGSLLLRSLNWVASWLLLWSAISLSAHVRCGASVLDHKVLLLVVMMSVNYLCAVFGGKLIFRQADALGQASETARTARARGSIMFGCWRLVVVQGVLVMCAVVAAMAAIIACTLSSSDIYVFVGEASRAVAWLATPVAAVAAAPPAGWTMPASLPWLLAATMAAVALVVYSGTGTQASVSAVAPGDPGQAKLVADARDRMRAASYPKPFPNGWFKLCNSDSLARGAVKYIEAAGKHLAVFRGRVDGRVGVLNAYCPHLGANLAVGGTVDGDKLVCPFHRWSFTADGAVADIPYAKVPSVASTQAYHVVEYYGMVCVFIDAEGRAPTYYPPRVPELDSGAFAHRGDFVAKDVRMHLQEFAENSVDFQHFDPLHGRMMVPWTTYSIPGVLIDHVAEWVPGSDDEGPHIAHFRDHASLRIGKWHLPKSSADADITFVGPAGIVMFRFMLPELGDILMFQTHLPLAPALQHCEFRWFADPAIPRALVWYVVGNWVSQWGNDRQVWENKVFLQRPLLVRGDGPVQKLRRWYQQFYAGGEPRVRVATPATTASGDDTQQQQQQGSDGSKAVKSRPRVCAASPALEW